MEKQGTVHMIPCKDCSRPYIGETKQPLGARVKQHKAKTAAADMLNGPAYHTFHHDHKVDFEGVLILDTEKQTWLRKTKEAHESGPWLYHQQMLGLGHPRDQAQDGMGAEKEEPQA